MLQARLRLPRFGREPLDFIGEGLARAVQKAWIVPTHGRMQMVHMLEHSGAAAVGFSPQGLKEFNTAASAARVRGARTLESSLAYSELEAPVRR